MAENQKTSGIKRPLSGFMVFSCQKRKEIHKEKMSLSDSTRILSKMWKNMSDTEKEPYNEISTRDKQRYAEQLLKIGRLPQKHRRSSNPGTPSNEGSHKDESKPSPAPKRRRTSGASRSRSLPLPEEAASQDGMLGGASVLKHTLNATEHMEGESMPAKQQRRRVDKRPATLSQSINASSLQNAVVPNVGIPIFTEEFLVYNKKLNSDLMKLRQLNKDMVEQKQRLEDALHMIEKDIHKLSALIEQQVFLNDTLVAKLQIIKKTISNFVNPSEQLSTEDDMIDKILNESLSDEILVKLVDELHKIIPDGKHQD